MQGAIGFGLASYWLLIAEKLEEIFKPITKCNNRNHVSTLDSHLKTALLTEDNQQTQKGRWRLGEVSRALTCHDYVKG